MPNLPVDVDSWGRSACYPQGSFYPLSDGNSHSHTAGSLTPTFVTARSVDLAVRLSFAFTLKSMVSIHAERTFERLRYLLGGDRPSQTARLTMSPDQIHGRRLESQYSQSGIPRVTPHGLTSMFPSLPLILYRKYRDPISGCSEAPWGLSVLPRVTGIFTGTTISPGG